MDVSHWRAITHRRGYRVVDSGYVRHVRMGKGVHFDPHAVVFEPNRHLRWTYEFTEDSFPPNALDEHVEIGGLYFDVLDTEYVMNPSARTARNLSCACALESRPTSIGMRARLRVCW